LQVFKQRKPCPLAKKTNNKEGFSNANEKDLLKAKE
jgi:hypothetical protein